MLLLIENPSTERLFCVYDDSLRRRGGESSQAATGTTMWPPPGFEKPTALSLGSLGSRHCPLPIPQCALFRREVLTQSLPLPVNGQCALCNGQWNQAPKA